MFEHFTEPAQRVVRTARAEALSLGHDEIDTPHLLLGLLMLEEEPVAEVLTRNGVTAEQARTRSRELGGAGEPASDQPQFTAAGSGIRTIMSGSSVTSGLHLSTAETHSGAVVFYGERAYKLRRLWISAFLTCGM